MKRYLLLAIYIILITGCNQNSSTYQNLDVINVDKNIAIFAWEDILIPIDSRTLTDYAVFTSFDNLNIDYFGGYNKQEHSIDIFDITNRCFLKHIILDSKGPNGVGKISGLFIHNWDSIFAYNNFELCILDSTGIIKSRNSMKNFTIIDKGKKGSLSSTIDFPLHYLRDRKSLLFKYTPRDVRYCGKKFYETPFIAEYNLVSNTLELLPVYYSNFFNKEKNVGDFFIPFVSVYNEFICYSFRGESNIYLYNFDKDENEVFGARSKFTNNTTKTLSSKAGAIDKQIHEITSVDFLFTYYDKYRNIFYRLHYGNQEYQISQNEFKTFDDKDLYLMIFNYNFELIKEFKLHNYTFYPSFCGVVKEGLLLNANHVLNSLYNEDTIHFKLLKIDK